MYDDSGHGTHVAGTALGLTSGLAKCATLRPVRILDGDGKGKSSSILEALDWIAAQDVASPGGRKIVSMSLGGPRSQAVDDAVAEMAEVHGVPVIVAAGKRSERRRRHEPRRRRVRNRRREHELLPRKRR
jgi:subtilisin family serine protease